MSFINRILSKKDSVLSDAALYSFATGLNRGVLLLMFPILLSFLKISEYGVFVLAFSVSQMLIPFITISGTAGIIREGSEDYSVGTYLLERFIIISTINFTLGILFSWIFNSLLEGWIYFSICFGFLNAIFELFLSFFRTVDKKKQYFIYTVIKSVILLIAVLIAKYAKFDLPYTFSLLIFSQLFLTFYLVFILRLSFIKEFSKKKISVRAVLKYTAYIIPHGLALWLMNSSDKLIIKWLLGEVPLGIYSVSYTIASLQILVNSGLSIALPQVIYKDFDRWLKYPPRIKILSLFGIISLILNVVIIIGLKIDQYAFHLVKNIDQVKQVISFVIPGLYLAGVYQFYSIFIFYKKQTRSIFLIGIVVASLNVGLNFLLIPHWGIIGAALTTLLTFVLYVVSIVFYVLILVPEIKISFYKEALIISGFTILNSVMFYLFL